MSSRARTLAAKAPAAGSPKDSDGARVSAKAEKGCRRALGAERCEPAGTGAGGLLAADVPQDCVAQVVLRQLHRRALVPEGSRLAARG